MLSAVLNFMLYLLTPNRPRQWLWKLLILCVGTASFAYLFRLAVGMPPEVPVPVYILVVSLIASPFFLLGIAVARRLLHLQQELARLASTDLLTGLDNRHAFFSKIEQLAEGTILMMDIDHFKSVNDTYGHPAGDAVLIQVAQHIKSSVRSSDPVARIGGEEFAVFLRAPDPNLVREISQRICNGLSVQNVPGTSNLAVTLSVGVADVRPDNETTDIMKKADEALYAAKRAGRACAVFWSELASRTSYSAATFETPSISAK